MRCRNKLLLITDELPLSPLPQEQWASHGKKQTDGAGLGWAGWPLTILWKHDIKVLHWLWGGHSDVRAQLPGQSLAAL